MCMKLSKYLGLDADFVVNYSPRKANASRKTGKEEANDISNSIRKQFLYFIKFLFLKIR